MADFASPFQKIHSDLNANMASYHNWQLPSDYGDTHAETQKLYQNCCAFDLSSFGRIEITGENAHQLISFLLPVDTSNLTNGKIISSVICTEKGHIADFVRVLAKKDAFVILTTPPKRDMILKLAKQSAAKTTLGDLHINDITDATAMMGLYGPKSYEMAKKILPFDLTDLTPATIKHVNVFMVSATIIRHSCLGIEGVEIITPAKAAAFAGMAIEKYEKKGTIQPAGMDCLNRAFLESSLPVTVNCRAETQKYDIFNLALADKINKQKNFLGKEPLLANASERAQKTAVSLKIPGLKKPHNDLSLQYDDGKIGWVDTIDYSKYLDSGIGIAIIDSEFADLTQEVQIEGDGLIIGAEIAKLPLNKDLANNIY